MLLERRNKLSKDKLLQKVKESLLWKHQESKYNLERVVPYYLIIKNAKNEILDQLIDDCNKYDFLLNYEHEKDNYYTFGTMTIHIKFDKTADDDFFCYRNANDYHYKIDLLWYEHGSTDEYLPRIIVKKIMESVFIEFNDDSTEEFNNWYSELRELHKKEKSERLKSIERQIKELTKQKEELSKNK